MKRIRWIRGFFAAVFLLSLLALFLQYRQKKPAEAAIYQDGKQVASIREGEITTLRIEDENGNYNVIEAGLDGVRVIESSCPDHICEQSKWEGKGSMPIICLPNRLVITAAEMENREMDGVTY